MTTFSVSEDAPHVLDLTSKGIRSRIVKNQRPIAAEEEHRVLQFRPRNSRSPAELAGQTWPRSPNARIRLPNRSTCRATNGRGRSRTISATACWPISPAFAFTIALTAIGIWLAMSIADLRKTQDCVLMGRRDCVRISTP